MKLFLFIAYSNFGPVTGWYYFAESKEQAMSLDKKYQWVASKKDTHVVCNEASLDDLILLLRFHVENFDDVKDKLYISLDN